MEKKNKNEKLYMSLYNEFATRIRKRPKKEKKIIGAQTALNIVRYQRGNTEISDAPLSRRLLAALLKLAFASKILVPERADVDVQRVKSSEGTTRKTQAVDRVHWQHGAAAHEEFLDHRWYLTPQTGASVDSLVHPHFLSATKLEASIMFRNGGRGDQHS
jgi:hypothetical protein